MTSITWKFVFVPGCLDIDNQPTLKKKKKKKQDGDILVEMKLGSPIVVGGQKEVQFDGKLD